MQKKAATLKYDAVKEKAPKVTASGRGLIAEAIIKKAEAAGISIFQNSALADALTQIELNQSIEPELYEAVAEVFAWLMQIETETKP